MAVLGALGLIPFICSDGMVQTFNSFRESRSESFAEHKVIAGTPVLEWTGHGVPEYSIDIRLDSSLGTSPALIVKALKVIMKAHTSVTFLVGPRYIGRVVVESMDVDETAWTGIGVTQVATVSLRLKGVSDGYF